MRANTNFEGTIAQAVARLIGAADAVAVTLAGGYLVQRSGGRTLFPAARIEDERRNEQGRCTRLDARYADGSGLRFSWHPSRGVRYDAL